MPKGRPLSEEQNAEIRRLYRGGMKATEIAKRIGCHRSVIHWMMQHFPSAPRSRSPKSLTVEEREEIAHALTRKESCRSIARQLGRAPSTVAREVKGFDTEETPYRAYAGETRAAVRAKRPKPSKFDKSPELKKAVEEGLKNDWSPQQISKTLAAAHPDNPAMNISHETVYQKLFCQARGSLRKELTKHLRTQRTRRKPHGRTVVKTGIKGMVNISERPAEVADRAVPGHWEGDLIIGKDQKSAIGTLVERSTRFVMLLHLPDGRTADVVCAALAKKILTLPDHLRRSITWDQGKELAQHARFTVETGVDVYFCDPHSPWQRGSNENTNGLLRQYFPKGTDLSVHDEAHLDAIAQRLNTRPRQTLGWETPSRKLTELLR